MQNLATNLKENNFPHIGDIAVGIDVRNHVKAIEKRSYINPAEGTVDYVLMFIPNESVYAFLNQEDKDLIDFSLTKKVLLCSPITLYAVLSLIRQAVSNFAMEQKAGEMQDLVGVFRKQWEQFSEKIHAMGKSITALTNHYDDLKGPRFRALEKPMDKINELQLGQDSKNKTLEEREKRLQLICLFLFLVLGLQIQTMG